MRLGFGPPVMALIKNYLPFITDKNTRDGAVIPKSTRRLLAEAIEVRNEIVHKGAATPSEEKVTESLNDVRDFLYVLDWLQGLTWAFSRISAQASSEFSTGVARGE